MSDTCTNCGECEAQDTSDWCESCQVEERELSNWEIERETYD